MTGWRVLLVRVAAPLYLAWVRSWRVRVHLADGRVQGLADYDYTGEIFAVCERDLVAVSAAVRHARFLALIAPGRDGDWAAWLAERYGCAVVRGGHARNGSGALRQLQARAATWTGPIVIVVDGPVGPAGVPHPGTGLLARSTGRVVRPVSAAARPSLRVPNTWSGLYLPAPWARIVIALGPPAPTCGPGRADRAAWALSLGKSLEHLRQIAVREGVA